MGLDKIEEYKKKLGLTSAELADRAGIPKTTLDKILSGVTKDPKLETLKAIARVLGLTLDDFDDKDVQVNKETEPAYEDIMGLVARNGKHLTAEQKQDIIRKLLSED